MSDLFVSLQRGDVKKFAVDESLTENTGKRNDECIATIDNLTRKEFQFVPIDYILNVCTRRMV